MRIGAVKTALVYAGAVLIGLATPFIVLWIARGTPPGSDPEVTGVSVIVAVGIIAGLFTAAAPRHWLALALIVSVPLGVLAGVMFWAFLDLGEYFWIWLWVGLGALAAALAAAFLVARARRA